MKGDVPKHCESVIVHYETSFWCRHILFMLYILASGELLKHLFNHMVDSSMVIKKEYTLQV